MKNYELLFILPGTLTEEETEPFVEKVKNTLTENSATNLILEAVGKNRLAYPIKHIRYGYIYLLRFEAEPEQVLVINERLRLVEGLLRSLVQLYDPTKQKEAKINFINLRSPEQEKVTQSQKQTPKREVSAEGVKKESQPEESEQDKVIKTEKGTEEEEKQDEKVDESQKELLAKESVEEKAEKSQEKTVSFEEIDKKLDELLDSDIASV